MTNIAAEWRGVEHGDHVDYITLALHHQPGDEIAYPIGNPAVRVVDADAVVQPTELPPFTPAGADDLRAGPLEVDRIADWPNDMLLEQLAKAATIHDDMREEVRTASRDLARALEREQSARRSARQLGAELNRRLAR